MNDFKKLLGDTITEETANTLQTIMDTHLNEAEAEKEKIVIMLAEKTAEVQELNERLREFQETTDDEIATLTEAKELEIQFLKEKAEEYADIARQEAIDEVSAQANAYGEYLQERAEAYGAHLIARGNAYGEHLIEKAEQYGEHLIEQADQYASEQVELTETRCLKESEKQILEFKEQYLEEFERVDEHARMATVFKNLKQLVESSGFSIEDSDQLDTISEEVRALRVKTRRLERTIRENAEELKTAQIEKMINSIDEDVAFTDKERIIKSVLNTRCETDAELNTVVKTLVEGVTRSPRIPAKSVLNESVKTGSGWASRLV